MIENDGTPVVEVVVVDMVVDAVPRKIRRRRRRTRPRARTIPVKKMTREEIRIGREMYPPITNIERPRVRGDCFEGQNAKRPCPWISCKQNLYLDINPETGSLKINFPDLEPWEIFHSCALDLADRGGITLEEVGNATNTTRERARQIEVRALLKIAAGRTEDDFESPLSRRNTR